LGRARTRVGETVRTLPRPLAIAAVSGSLLAASGVAGSAVLHEAEPRPVVQASDTPSADVDATVESPQSRPEDRVARSSDRPSLAELKADTLADDATGAGRHVGPAQVSREALATSDTDPRDIARAMLPQYGWSESEFSCLDELWIGESDWEWNADNPTSSAYGIPQALPAEKMASAGPDWLTNPATQIEWGLGYIRDVYGTPCSANAFKNANNWY
jgi:hypothetical protein